MQKLLTLRQAIDHFRPEFVEHDQKLWQITHGFNYFRTIPNDIIVHYILPACGHLRQTYSRSQVYNIAAEYADFLDRYQLLNEYGNPEFCGRLPKISRTMTEAMGVILQDDAEHAKLKIYGGRINNIFLNNTPISMCKYIGNSRKIAYDLCTETWRVYDGSTDYPMPDYHYQSVWILPCGLIFVIAIENQDECKSHNFVMEIPAKLKSQEYLVKYVEVADVTIRSDMELTHLIDDFGNIFATNMPEDELMLSEICSIPAHTVANCEFFCVCCRIYINMK